MSGLDRAAAREVLYGLRMHVGAADYDAALDALEGCVRPAPQQTIDRGALEAELSGFIQDADADEPLFSREELIALAQYQAGRILALLRPIDGVMLTREECEHAADWHDHIVDHGGEMPAAETEIALRLRTAAAS